MANAAVETDSDSQVIRPEAAAHQSYRQILRSSAIIGGSSAMNIAIGVLRTKAMAVILGPSGVGLAGLYGSIADVAVSVAGMGVNSSGVRQIAEAVGTGDTQRIARTASVLRRTSVLLGVFGALLLLAFSYQASVLTFGNGHYAAAVSLLSLAVLFRLVSNGQGALIQGTRRIADLAKMNVAGALLGTIVGIPVVYLFREEGVVPSLVAAAGISLFASWRYSRKIDLPSACMTPPQVGRETAALLKLGCAFMASGLMMMGSAYAVRIIVFHKLGFEATGLYQAAWTLGGLYVGMIVQSMGADFYPRLTAAAGNNAACNRLVNEQARVGLLLAGPGIIATLTFAPIVLSLFYSARFGGAVEILRWVCLGVAMRVITWPMGYIVIAKGAPSLFFWSDVAWTVVNVGLTLVCISSFGLKGSGIAFFGSYVFHGLLIYPIVRRISGFRWSPENHVTGFLFLLSIAVVFCGCVTLPFPAAVGLGVVCGVLSSAYSIRVLFTVLSIERVPRPVSRFLVRFGFVPAVAPEAR